MLDRDLAGAIAGEAFEWGDGRAGRQQGQSRIELRRAGGDEGLAQRDRRGDIGDDAVFVWRGRDLVEQADAL